MCVKQRNCYKEKHPLTLTNKMLNSIATLSHKEATESSSTTQKHDECSLIKLALWTQHIGSQSTMQ